MCLTRAVDNNHSVSATLDCFGLDRRSLRTGYGYPKKWNWTTRNRSAIYARSRPQEQHDLPTCLAELNVSLTIFSGFNVHFLKLRMTGLGTLRAAMNSRSPEAN